MLYIWNQANMKEEIQSSSIAHHISNYSTLSDLQVHLLSNVVTAMLYAGAKVLIAFCKRFVLYYIKKAIRIVQESSPCFMGQQHCISWNQMKRFS